MKSNTTICLKVISILIIYFLIHSNVQAQISYSYDSNGNRILRCVELKKSSEVKDSSEIEIKFQDELDGIMIQVYPNPTHGSLNLEVTGLKTEKAIEYKVFNISGTMLFAEKVTDPQFKIDFNPYPSGIYVLRLMVDNKVSEWKIIKE